MIKNPPIRDFYTLEEVAKRWRVDASEIWQWFIEGELLGHIRIPLISVFLIQKMSAGTTVQPTRELRHWQGYIRVSRFHCQRFYEHGKLTLREFTCDRNEERYQLPDEVDDLVISTKRFGILSNERKRFEQLHGVASINAAECEVHQEPYPPNALGTEPSFRTVRYQGREYYLGDMQADIIRQLYEAAFRGEPWQSGKQLLHKAGSHSFNLLKLFKRNALGKQLIVSDGRGYYRIHQDFLSTLHQN